MLVPTHPDDPSLPHRHRTRLHRRSPTHLRCCAERTDFLEGDAPAAAKVEAFLTQALAACGSDAQRPPAALVPWICDALLSNHSVKAYGRDLADFVRHMQAQGVDPLHVTADHVKLYKRALLEAGLKSGHRRPAALRAARHLQAARRQGADRLGNGPGHRRHQGPRRPEEFHAVADPAAGHRPAGGDPDRYACKGSATWR